MTLIFTQFTMGERLVADGIEWQGTLHQARKHVVFWQVQIGVCGRSMMPCIGWYQDISAVTYVTCFQTPY